MVCGRGVSVEPLGEKENLRSMSHRALQVRAEQLGVPDHALHGAESEKPLSTPSNAGVRTITLLLTKGMLVRGTGCRCAPRRAGDLP